MRLFILFTLFISFAHGGDDKLPADAQRIVDKTDAALEAAKRVYDEQVSKLRANEIKDLTRAKDAATSRKDLDGALAVKARIDKINEEENVDLLSAASRTLIILSAKYGTESHAIDLTKLIRSKVVNGSLNFANDDSTNADLEDPAPGATKSFTVIYSLDGKTQVTATFAKNHPIKIGDQSDTVRAH